MADSTLADYSATADGQHLYFSYRPTGYNDEDVKLRAFSDIRKRTRIEDPQEKAGQKAEVTNEAKTLSLAILSHEIRTPQRDVFATLELLARPKLAPQRKDHLNALESSSSLQRMICDVLDVSKIEAGQLALELNEFCVLELTRDVVQAYAAAAQSKGLQLYTCYDPKLPCWLIGDVARIRQVLSNSLSNSVKCTDAGPVVLRISLQSREGERACCGRFRIPASAFPGDAQPLVFEPFNQTEDHANDVAGSGLGLPICLRLTQLMNGNIRMVSAIGLGSSFS